MKRFPFRILGPAFLLIMVLFLLGFSNQDNPLLGTWRCNTQETMESMDTSSLSDMEKMMYRKYLDSIELQVTEEEMTISNFQEEDTSRYEILEKTGDEILVYFHNDDSEECFNLLEEGKMSWTMRMKEKEIRCILERED